MMCQLTQYQMMTDGVEVTIGEWDGHVSFDAKP
jgi:hypothetical protein